MTLIHLDQLDSVRMKGSGLAGHRAQARGFALDAAVRSLVQARTPVLSQNELFDSGTLLEIADDHKEAAAFLEIVRRGWIKGRPFGGQRLGDAFGSALDNQHFELSGWPALQADKVLRDAALRYFSTGHTPIRIPDYLANRLRFVRSLDDAVWESQSGAAWAVKDTSLSKLVTTAAAQSNSQTLPRTLLNDVKAGRWGDPESRSSYYDGLKSPSGADLRLLARSEAFELVDACYNQIIARSLDADYSILSARRLRTLRALALRPSAKWLRAVSAPEFSKLVPAFTWVIVEKGLQTSKGDPALLREALSNYVAEAEVNRGGRAMVLGFAEKAVGHFGDVPAAWIPPPVGLFVGWILGLPGKALGRRVRQGLKTELESRLSLRYYGVLSELTDNAAPADRREVQQ